MEIKMSTASCSIAELSGICYHPDPRAMLEDVMFALETKVSRDWSFALLQFSDKCNRVDGLDKAKMFKDFLVVSNLATAIFDSGVFVNPNTGNSVRVCLVSIENRRAFVARVKTWLKNNPK